LSYRFLQIAQITRRIGVPGDAQQPGEARMLVAAQRLACAVLDDRAIFEDRDGIDTPDGRQVVGDDDGGAPVQQAIDRPRDQALGGRIEARRRLVEDDEAGIFEKDAYEGEQLGFPGGEAAGDQWRIQPSG
jgi:hypothetical protein